MEKIANTILMLTLSSEWYTFSITSDYIIVFSPQRLRYYECNKTWGKCAIKSQRFQMGTDNWGEKRLVKHKVLTRTLVRTMKKTCWSCLGGRDSQESNPRETNCDSNNSASAQSKESTSKSKTETASKQQIQKRNSQQNNSKSQAKTLTHCYAYSSFLWGLRRNG